MKGFSELGFKTQSQQLSHFQEDYGLKGDDEEEEEEEEDEDVDMDGESGDDTDESKEL